MAIEQVFQCPKTIARLRGGALGNLMEGFCQWLLNTGFGCSCIRRHLENVSHFNDFLGDSHTRPLETLSVQDVTAFFEEYPRVSCHRGPLQAHLDAVRASINRFVAYLLSQGLYETPLETPIYQPLLDGYLMWLRQEHGATDGTCGVRAGSLVKFFRWLGPQATSEGLSALNAEQVEQFFLAVGFEHGQAARRSLQVALRTFFRFCFQQGIVQQRLDRAVPTLRTYKRARPPRGLAAQQVQQVLAHVDRSSAAGQRDYAILQLLSTYGVRAGQIRALRLDDLHWTNDEILFRATKKGKDSLLPLTLEVGESLLTYLREARPAGCWPEVFLTCRAPFHPLAENCIVSQIVRQRLAGAGIEAPAHGAHVFRHAFATRMLAEGHSLKAIGDVLGHRYLSTTFIYTTVDFEALADAALPWPEEGTA